MSKVKMILGQNDFKLFWYVFFFVLGFIVINLEQKKIHFDLRFILTYNIYIQTSDKMAGETKQ